jgi:hypothetical protein
VMCVRCVCGVKARTYYVCTVAFDVIVEENLHDLARGQGGDAASTTAIVTDTAGPATLTAAPTATAAAVAAAAAAAFGAAHHAPLTIA